MPDTYSKRLSKAKDKTKELSKIMLEQDISDIVDGNVRIKIKTKKLSKGGNLEIHPEVFVDGELVIFPKNVFPLVYVSPPYRIGTGVFTKQMVGEEEQDVEGSEENPKKALEAIVLRTITNLIKKWQQ